MPPRTATAVMSAVLVLALAGAAPAHGGVATDEMVACAALGAKHPGSAADTAMGDRIVDRFRRAGLQTSTESFHLPVWEAARATLSIAAGPGAGTSFPVETFAYSGTGHVNAEIVDLGDGMPSDYDGKDVRGKIVLVDNGGAYHRTVQIQQVSDHGGAAMLYVSGSPRNLIQTGSVRWAQRPPARIPALTMGSQTGAALRAQMKQGTVTADLDAEGRRVDAVTRNVIGIRRGATYPDKYVVVAGHYDSWYSGANDNCSADGTLLSVVDANKDQAPAYTMIYIGWGAEEPGLVGSYTWIARHQDLMRSVVLNVNLEETASATFNDGTATALPSATIEMGSTSPTMLGLSTAAAASNAVTAPVVAPMVAERAASGGIIATDIEGFYAQGVQDVGTASSSPYYHTTGDTSDTVNSADLEKVSGYIRDVTRQVQLVPPESLVLQEVPVVKVSAPATATPGAAVPVDISITSPAGQPISDDKVLVLADQNDNWAVAETVATPLGGGRYRWTLPAGTTDADLTRIRATTSTTAYLAHGFATIDMRKGGLLTDSGAQACRSRRAFDLHVARHVRGARVTRLRATTSRGIARVRRTARGYVVRLDLRKVERGTVRVRLAARTRRGTVVQTRVYRTCTRRSQR